MAREMVEKPEIHIGDRVWLNHSLHDFPPMMTYYIQAEDACHYYVYPEPNSAAGYRVRKDAVRLCGVL